MVLVQNKYKNTLVSVLRTQITFIMHSSPSCYVTLRPQKTDSGVFIILFPTTLVLNGFTMYLFININHTYMY